MIIAFSLCCLALSSWSVQEAVQKQNTGCGSSDIVMQYDDGQVSGSYGTRYLGVWFDVDDFGPPCGFSVIALEYWFDVSGHFTSILANGPITGPTTDSLMRSAQSIPMSAVFVYFDNVEMESQFWGICDTEFPIGPMLLQDVDGFQPFHSYKAYDYQGPWGPPLMGYGDFFIRAHGDILTGLAPSTWGSIKSVFLN